MIATALPSRLNANSSISSTTSDVWVRDVVGSSSLLSFDKAMFDTVGSGDSGMTLSSYDTISSIVSGRSSPEKEPYITTKCVAASPRRRSFEFIPAASQTQMKSISKNNHTSSIDVIDELMATFHQESIDSSEELGLNELIGSFEDATTDSDDSSYAPSSSCSSSTDYESDNDSKPSLEEEMFTPGQAMPTMPSFSIIPDICASSQENQDQQNPQRAKASKQQQQPTEYITKDNINVHKDILCVRGGEGNNNPANKSYLAEIRNARAAYKALDERTEKKQKKQLSLGIVDKIKSNGGRFLRRDKVNKELWYELGRTETFRKVSQALRDETPEASVVVSMPKKETKRTSNKKRKAGHSSAVPFPSKKRMPVQSAITVQRQWAV